MRPRDAATVMLLRDGPGGLEVLLQQRNLRSEFVGGVHVFPGGAVDDADLEVPARRCEGRTDAECSARLGLERGGLALWVAALRECFEEAGVLLARRRGHDQVLSFVDPAVAARFAAHRAAVNAGRPFLDVLEEEDLVLDVDLVHYVSHWVTPDGAPRRYDTRFFVAPAPAQQAPLHDDAETVATIWMAPGEALRRRHAGEIELLLPTIRNLDSLLPFAEVSEVMAAAREMGEVPTVRPRLLPDGEGMRILMPGDPGYDQAGSAPTGTQRWPRRPGAREGGLR